MRMKSGKYNGLFDQMEEFSFSHSLFPVHVLSCFLNNWLNYVLLYMYIDIKGRYSKQTGIVPMTELDFLLISESNLIKCFEARFSS